MDTNLRQDIMAIVLIEAFGYDEEQADYIVTGKVKPKTTETQRDVERADTIVNRIDARCSKIVG